MAEAPALQTEDTASKERPAHLFQPGQSGNPAGRPKGARSKLGEDFLKAMQEDFALHGIKAVESVRETKPDQYLKVIASILPKEFDLGEQTQDILAALLGRIDGRTRTINQDRVETVQ